MIPYALYRFLYSSESPRKWKRYRISFILVAIHLLLSKGGSNGSPLAPLRQNTSFCIRTSRHFRGRLLIEFTALFTSSGLTI